MASNKIEELPDDFDEHLNISPPQPAPEPAPATSANGPALPSLEALMSGSTPFPLKHDPSATDTTSNAASARMPPAMESVRQHTADEVLELMNRVPLFMTSLDETDGAGGENLQLEALKALAYEGTRAEIAANFKEQGNEMAKAKRWVDAREYYDKALAALRMSEKDLRKVKMEGDDDEEDQLRRARGEGEGDAEVRSELEVKVATDAVEEKRKEREMEEACCVNRALCSLEMKNYGSCNRDCAAVLMINPANVKAWYRSATACLALDKIAEAEDACSRGLEVDAENAALNTLSGKITKRKQHLETMDEKRREREKRALQEQTTLKVALKSRNIPTRTTTKGPDMEDAVMHLEDPLDPASNLRVPAVLLYPADLKSDFIKAIDESESVGQHLTYIFPLPWDEKQQYTPEGVECYIETVSGGLIKAGKKLALLRLLSSGKIEVVDGMLKINVVPKAKAAAWIEEFKRQHPTR